MNFSILIFSHMHVHVYILDTKAKLEYMHCSKKKNNSKTGQNIMY